MDHEYCRVSPPVPENVLTLDNVGSVSDCDGSSDCDGDSYLSDQPPSKSCNCGKCPYSPGPVEQLMDASPSSLPTIVGGDSDWDGEIFMIRPPGPGRFVCPHDDSRWCSSPSEPGSPDSRETVSDSSSDSEEASSSSYDASDEYDEGDDWLPSSSSSPTREMSSEPEPDPDGLVSSVDLQLGASCEVPETALSPLPVLRLFRIYTSEEESFHAQQRVHWHISDRTFARWFSRQRQRPARSRGYYVTERAIRGRRRHRPWYGQAKRIRLDNASWDQEANSSSETIPEEVPKGTPTRLFASYIWAFTTERSMNAS